MATRHVYLVRHGEADAFGELTDTGRRQVSLLADRLAALPIDAVRHSPLPRAAASAAILGERLGVPAEEAAELIDHVPHVPDPMRPEWAGFFDGFDAAEAEAGARLADALTARFARPAETEVHEVLVTHAYQVAWMVCHALDAPPDRWLGLNSGNTALTAIDFPSVGVPRVILFNDMGHLPNELRWTGFGGGVKP
ncbi:histidine phosphatase family protein [Glycomyces albidus]|uniref:Histidine phosphatase family protein n=1 Tax=Glycomyces albidus TaxID=2656774 RepID=A0A6L5GCW6_9ACTN|nr:histidine phosphatase family protein [Glycomyces albidus]MQM27478.1 histidine phosphatase family protein [Glycomyces albidus]